MMKRDYTLWSRLFGMLLTLVISITICNRVLFTHVHILADGTHVTHAHPFNQEEGKPTQQEQHTHTSAELFFILALDTLFVFSAVLAFLTVQMRHLIMGTKQPMALLTIKTHPSPGRAPPQRF